MSQTSSKKSVFDRIGGNLSSTTTNVANKSTHGFCNAFVKTGSCPLGDTCKYIHEQPNLEKQTGSKDDMRTTKPFTRVVDMSSSSIKSTITISNEQRSGGVSNPIQSSRMVVETPNTNFIEHSDRRSSGSDRKQSSDSKSKSSSKKKSHSSSHDTRHSSNKRTRSNDDGDSPVSSASDSEHVHSSHKHKRKSDSHSKSSKYRKHPSISPNRDEEETLNDQLMSQSQNYSRSPKRTIVITERKKDEKSKRSSHSSKSKTSPDIEFLGLKSTKSEKKPTETIHQQAENIRKTIEIKREKKSPNRSITSDHQRHHSSSTSSNLTVKTEHQSSKTQNPSESSDRTVSHSTPLVVHLSPVAVESTEKESATPVDDPEKSTAIQPPSPVCVILDDDSSPTPSIDKKFVRQISEKKSTEPEKSSSKSTKRSRDSDRTQNKDNVNEYSDSKRKRLNDETSKKTTSSSKSSSDKRSSSNRSDAQRSTNISSRDDSSSRKYPEKSELKTSRQSDSKDRHPVVSTSSKSRSNHDRHDASKSSSDKKRSTYRREKEKGLENVTDSEEHHDEPVPPKPTALELYMSMDWSALSRDKRIPLNTQVTSRTVHSNHSINVCERFLTDEQKAQLNGLKCQTYPLTDFVKQLQNQSTPSIVQSCQRRFGSCAKDMLDMRHKWFIKSIEPVQSYEFINKEHYLAYQQAINTLLDRTSTDVPTVQIETTTADVLLS